MSKGNIHRDSRNSRTKGSKPVGFDYTSKRPGSFFSAIGRAGKKSTIRRERMSNKTAMLNQDD